MIYFVTGPIRSGKTTMLLKWSAGRDDVYGILTPDKHDRKVFLDLRTKEQFSMETDSNSDESLVIGKFVFDKKNFEKAIQIVRDGILQSGWLIIDEIGPLELKGEGFHDVLKEAIATGKNNLILVIREGLFNEVKEYFQLESEIFSPFPSSGNEK